MSTLSFLNGADILYYISTKEKIKQSRYPLAQNYHERDMHHKVFFRRYHYVSQWTILFFDLIRALTLKECFPTTTIYSIYNMLAWSRSPQIRCEYFFFLFTMAWIIHFVVLSCEQSWSYDKTLGMFLYLHPNSFTFEEKRSVCICMYKIAGIITHLHIYIFYFYSNYTSN